MITYLKKSVKGYYVNFEKELDPNRYNNIGTTYKDFQNNLWVKLSKKQVKFHEENPSATTEEVFNMKLYPTPDPLVVAKEDIIAEINVYDTSEAVNGFTVEGIEGVYWFDPTERSNYKQSVEAAKTLGNSNISFYLGNNLVTIPVEKAEYLLAMLQHYADQCYIVTKTHKLEVEGLNDLEAVENYDYKANYPDRPNFVLN